MGVLAFELLTGNAPFENDDIQKTYMNITKHKISYPRYLSDASVDFIRRILRQNPNMRLSLADMLKHPFITKYND